MPSSILVFSGGYHINIQCCDDVNDDIHIDMDDEDVDDDFDVKVNDNNETVNG